MDARLQAPHAVVLRASTLAFILHPFALTHAHQPTWSPHVYQPISQPVDSFPSTLSVFFPSTPWRPHCLVIHSPQFLLVRAQNSHQPATTRPHPHPLPSAQLQNWEDQPEYFKMIARRQNKLWKPTPFLVFVILPTVHVNLNSSSCCFYMFFLSH